MYQLERNHMEQYGDKYRKLQATEEQIEFNTILNIYCNQYRRRFLTPPIFVNDSHLITIKNLKKAVGERAIELVQHYFTMKDEWFQKQGYSIECLLAKINLVQADYSKKGTLSRGTDYRSVTVYCDACWAAIPKTVPMQYDCKELQFCTKCTTSGVTRPMKLTKEERQRVMNGLTESFKELPGADPYLEKERQAIMLENTK